MAERRFEDLLTCNSSDKERLIDDSMHFLRQIRWVRIRMKSSMNAHPTQCEINRQ